MTAQHITLRVSEEADAERLDKFIADDLENLDGMKDAFSRERIKALIQDGAVQVNGHVQTKPASRLKDGDEIHVSVPEPKPIDLKPDAIALDVVYEDDALLVVNKPSGMLTHPAGKEIRGTLVNALLAHCEGQLSGINGLLRPGIVHRLDRDTSGLLMVAKTDQAHRHLSRQLQERTAKRQYLAVVQGDMKDETGTVDAPIGRNPKSRERMTVIDGGRSAVTHWTVLERFQGKFCYVRLRLQTGRTHQIRVHMAHIGHPVLGDVLYGRGVEKNLVQSLGGDHRLKLDGQLLQAYRLTFVHPVSEEEVVFEIPVDPDLAQAVAALRQL